MKDWNGVAWRCMKIAGNCPPRTTAGLMFPAMEFTREREPPNWEGVYS